MSFELFRVKLPMTQFLGRCNSSLGLCNQAVRRQCPATNNLVKMWKHTPCQHTCITSAPKTLVSSSRQTTCFLFFCSSRTTIRQLLQSATSWLLLLRTSFQVKLHVFSLIFTQNNSNQYVCERSNLFHLISGNRVYIHILSRNVNDSSIRFINCRFLFYNVIKSALLPLQVYVSDLLFVIGILGHAAKLSRTWITLPETKVRK